MRIEDFKKIHKRYSLEELLKVYFETALLYGQKKYSKGIAMGENSKNSYDYYQRESDHMLERLIWLHNEIEEKVKKLKRNQNKEETA
jgi:hypothetical protein